MNIDIEVSLDNARLVVDSLEQAAKVYRDSGEWGKYANLTDIVNEIREDIDNSIMFNVYSTIGGFERSHGQRGNIEDALELVNEIVELYDDIEGLHIRRSE